MADEPEKTHYCGRRDDMVSFVAAIKGGDGAPRADPPKLDHWNQRGMEHPGATGAGQRACSYCGSMHPDDLFKAIEDGWELGPTDKNYKVYVSERHKDPAEASARAEAREKIGVDPLPPPRHHKFYFQHLDGAQQQRFVELLNDNKIRIGYPGHFYSLPFFITRAPKRG